MSKDETDKDPLLSSKQVSQRYGIPHTTLRWRRHKNLPPASFLLGARRVVYRESAVEAWIKEQEATTTRGGDNAA